MDIAIYLGIREEPTSWREEFIKTIGIFKGLGPIFKPEACESMEPGENSEKLRTESLDIQPDSFERFGL